MTPPGLEPEIFWSEVRRLIHLATSWDPQEDSTSCYYSNQGSSRCSSLAMVLKRYWLRISVVNSTIRSSRISPPNGSLSNERLPLGIHSREWKSGECRENLQRTAHKSDAKENKKDPLLANWLIGLTTQVKRFSTSPAQRLMGRHTHTLLPTAEKLLRPNSDMTSTASNLTARKRLQCK